MFKRYTAVYVMRFFLLGLWITAGGASADPIKTLRTAIPAAETGFDPVVAHDLYSAQVISSIMEPLYSYDYLARPVKLIPLTAAALPEVRDQGKTYIIRLKKGIYFADDPAFGGKKRELTAEDYAWVIRRLMDPRIRSSWSWLLEGKIQGLDALVAEARKTGKYDYHQPIPGLSTPDRYTLRIRLNKPDYNLPHILAHTPLSAMAREVVARYQDENGQVMANPVGTGAYVLKEWKRGARMVLEANPGYRGMIWDFKSTGDPEDATLIRQMKGKRLPQVKRVEISVIPEDQSRWLAFQNNELDLFNLDGPLAPKALDGGQLKPELRRRGVQLSRTTDLELSQYYFNMRDPVVGGLSKEKIALRRAIAMAHAVDEEIKVILRGQAFPLHYPIPPGVQGHDSKYRSSVRYDPARANALLDYFGYKKGADGWRKQPDGSPLTIVFSARADSVGQQQLEMWKKTFDSLGIRMQGDRKPFPEMLKAEKQCTLMMRTMAWIGDYPDGDNFMQLFYGGHIGQSNHGCMQIPAFDRLYEQTRQLPHGRERDRLYHKMTRMLEVYAPIRLAYARYRNMLSQPAVRGFKKHPVLHHEWLYMDMAP